MGKAAGKDKAILMAAFAKMDSVALAVALGSILGLLMFVLTAVLLIQGAAPGVEVGPHLALFNIYLPGYEVSWPGAFLGAAYFWVLGAIAGFILATLWNMTHHLFVAAIVVRAIWWDMMAD
ncbi:MAG: hypothetical protein HKO55_02025 [Gammaproteobacteria bacterium]|nr:hypothetical protein [Gammaproteobacteria bacterium]